MAIVESSGAVTVHLLSTNLDSSAERLVLSTNGWSPVVAFDTQLYVAAWCEPERIVVQPIDPSGQPAGLPLSFNDDIEDAEVLALVTNPRGRAVLVWRKREAETTTILARQAVHGGSPNIRTVFSGNAPAVHAAATACGTNFVLAWTDQGTNGAWAIKARFMDDDGEWLGLPVTLTESNASAGLPIGLGSDGTNVLVVWSRDTGPFPHNVSLEYTYAMIWGRLLDSSGSPLGDAFQIGRARGDQVCPQVAYDGEQYLVTWLDSRDNGSLRNPDIEALSNVWRLCARQVQPDGVLPEQEIRFGFRTGGTLASNAPVVVWDGARFVTAFGTMDFAAHAEFITRIHPPPIRLRGIQPRYGGVTMWMEGDTRYGYEVQVSTNLVDWYRRNSLTEPRYLDLGFYEFDGFPSEAEYPMAFYRVHFPAYDCIQTLREVEWAKYQWALEMNMQSVDAVPLYDLFSTGYLPEMPRCPASGAFTISHVGAFVQCSQHTHTIYGGGGFGGLVTE